MDRINKIMNHEEFINALNKIKSDEKNRQYCKHGMRHLLDVSRIAYIMVLENQIKLNKEVVYAAGLLHDIGKHVQYDKGIPHNIASAKLAPHILADCGFKEDEIELIVEAILCHRTLTTEDESSLSYILYKADKKSRNCFRCKESQKCNWDDKKKNKGIDF